MSFAVNAYQTCPECLEALRRLGHVSSYFLQCLKCPYKVIIREGYRILHIERIPMTILDEINNFNKALHDWHAIIIHHSATTDGRINDARAIKLWHMGKTGRSDPKSDNYNPYIAKPMRDVGYHALIEIVDTKLEIITGRSLAWDGGHTIGMNSKAIGICLVGNFDIKEPTPEQYFFISSLCRAYKNKFNIKNSDIFPHRKFANKTCPGSKFDMVKLYKYIEGLSA